MTDRLSIYNEALLICGERFLASLTEEREPRRLLDHVWDTGGVRHCLEKGQWRFAIRTVMVDSDPDISPAFGYRFGFSKPTDWVITSAVTTDEYFNTPLTQYVDEGANWFADIDPIYVKYVSDDDEFGMDLNAWPESFMLYVSAHFAGRIIMKLTTDSTRRQEILGPNLDGNGGLLESRLKTALNKDAMSQPTAFFPQGSWTIARQGQNIGRRDRGSRGRLIG